MANLKRDRIMMFKQYLAENKTRKLDYTTNQSAFKKLSNSPLNLPNPKAHNWKAQTRNQSIEELLEYERNGIFRKIIKRDSML